MKKKLPIKLLVVILLAVFLVSGGIATAMVFTQVVPLARGIDTNVNRIPYNETFELELNEGDNLRLSIPGAAIVVAPYDGDTLQATFEGTIHKDRQEEDRLVASYTGGHAQIVQKTEERRRLEIFSFGGFSSPGVRGTLTVQVPRKHLGKVEFDTYSGHIDARELDAQEFTADTSSGDILLRDLVAAGAVQVDTFSGVADLTGITAEGSATITTSSGNATLADLTIGGALNVDTFSGNIDAQRVAATGNAGFTTSSGTLRMEGIQSRNFTTDTFSGAATVADLVATGDANLDSSSGNVTITTADALSLNITTFSGKVDLSAITLDGDLVADTSSGAVAARGLTAAEANVVTFSGNVNLSDVAADNFDIESSSGRVDLGLLQGADILCDTFSGAVSLTLPADMGFALHFDTFSGRFESTFPTMNISGGKSTDATAGDGAHSVSVTTSSGNLDIAGQ